MNVAADGPVRKIDGATTRPHINSYYRAHANLADDLNLRVIRNDPVRIAPVRLDISFSQKHAFASPTPSRPLTRPLPPPRQWR